MVWHDEGSEFNCEFCQGLCTVQNGRIVHLLTRSRRCESPLAKKTAAQKIQERKVGLAAFADSLKYRTIYSILGKPIKEAWREEYNMWMSDDYYHQYKNMTLYMQLHPVDPEIDARARRGMEYWIKFNTGVSWKRPSEAAEEV